MKTPTPEAPLKIALAAGGTGGHIMPALAVGDALRNIGHPVEVEYLCGNRPVEREIYAQAGVAPRIFPVGSVTQGGAVRRVRQSLELGYSFARSMLITRRYDAVLGMGGYVAAPVLAAARLARVPIFLHESNTVLGKVNRMTAPKARRLACGLPLVDLPEGVPPERVVETGTPVRLNIARGDRREAAESMFLRPDVFTILVCGGSQGAVGLNECVARTLGRLSQHWPADTPLQVVWSTGPRNLAQVRESLHDEPLRGQLWIAPTIERMDHALAMADLVLGRAGGSFLAEIMLCGLPAILFPLAQAAGRHQLHNARVLEKAGAALIRDEREVEPDGLAREIAALFRTPAKLAAMAENARRLAKPDAARDLALLIVENLLSEDDARPARPPRAD